MSEAFDDLDAEAERIEAERAKAAKPRPPLAGAEKFDRIIKGHVSCLKPVMFIRRSDKEMVSRAGFDAAYNRVVNCIPELPSRYRDSAAKLATAADGLRLVKGTCYRPGQGELCDGLFNMWHDPGIAPLAETPKIFFAHMKYLFPNARERKLVVQWMAWAVQHPEMKLMFALLIVGEMMGTGKSWIGKMLEVIFGEDNATLLEDDAPLKSDFQEFKLHKRLLFVHEIAPDEKTDLVRALKGFITESSVRINRKGIERVKVENYCNLMGVTNYPNALKIVRSDRRWLVVHANDDVYGVNDRMEATKATEAYYTRLFDCIGTPDAPGDEARRILHYLANVVDLSDFAGKSLAPTTGAKDDVAAATETKIGEDVTNAREARQGPFRFTLFTVAEVMASCASVPPGAKQKAVEAETSQAMLGAGCRRIVATDGKARQVYLEGAQVRLWAASRPLAEKYGKMAPAEIAAAYKAEREAAGPEAAPKGDPGDFTDE